MNGFGGQTQSPLENDPMADKAAKSGLSACFPSLHRATDRAKSLP
jgi:hypothetical protein